jgi:molybdopterin converting factor small subunit
MAALLQRLQVQVPPEALLLVVNGRLVDLDYQFNEGDTVSLMPALSRGI